ncbi:MAG: hypothetical protein ACRET6_01840 [Burkholderiales bacterium]
MQLYRNPYTDIAVSRSMLFFAWIDVVLDNVAFLLKPTGIFTLGSNWTF